MSHRTHPRLRVTFGVGLFLMAFCAGVYTASAQTAQFIYAITTLGGSFNNPNLMAVDASGNVYVADENNNLVKEIPPGCASSSCVILLGSGFDRPTGVAVDGKGNVYVTEYFESRVVEMPPGCTSSSCITTLGGGFGNPYGVAVDGTGNIYIADEGYDAGTSAVYEMPPGCASSSCVTALGGGFHYPIGIAVDGNSNIYVGDAGNGAVKEMPPGCASSSCVTTLGRGFASPDGVVVDKSGNVYVGDYGNNALKEMPPGCASSSCVTTLGGGFSIPQGVAVDGNGNVYLSDSGHNEVKEVMTHGVNFHTVPVGTPSTAITLTFTFSSAGTIGAPAVLTQGAKGLDFADAGTGSCSTNGTSHTYNAGDTCTVDVTFTPAYATNRYGGVELRNDSGTVIANAYVYGTGAGPQLAFLPGQLRTLGPGSSNSDGVAIDGAGNIYFSVFAKGTVEEMPPACTSSSCVTTLGGGFNQPKGLAVDGSGNLYVADPLNEAVKEMPPGCASASCVTTLGGGFLLPGAVAVDGSGNVYVAEFYGIREMPPGCTSSDCVTTLGGGFDVPEGVAVDVNGNVYVADTESFAVKEMPPGCTSSSCVTTLGSDYSGPGVGFFAPSSVAVDGNGNVYIGDVTYGLSVMPPGCASASCITTLTREIFSPVALALDGNGNLYTPTGSVAELDVADPPSLSFAQIILGEESSDSSQTVTLKNIGNAALSLPVPSTGQNPSISDNFTLDSTTTCPEVGSSSSPGTLAANASCTLVVDFLPQMPGTIAGSLVLTDNSLSAHYATQTIGLSGSAVQAIPTTVSLRTTANPVEVGGQVLLIAQVTPIPNLADGYELCYTFDGQGPFCLTPDSTGRTVFSTAALTPGVHNVVASFSTTGIYLGSTSAVLQEIVSTVPANIAVVAGSGQSTPYGLEFTEPLVALVTDAHGNPVPGATVSFSGTGLRFSSTTTVTNASGQATVRAYPTTTGTLTALASVTGVGTAASFSLNATKPMLLVKANSATYAFDQPIPAPTYSFTGFVNGDTAATAVTGSAAISTPAKQGSPAGTYPLGIVQGTLSAPNYNLEFEQGTVTITP